MTRTDAMLSNLKGAMERYKISQPVLAACIGVSTSTINAVMTKASHDLSQNEEQTLKAASAIITDLHKLRQKAKGIRNQEKMFLQVQNLEIQLRKLKDEIANTKER